ncbi:MAG: sugar phosphate isomerase/epimerase [Ruminococcaceae bacterium]|nr:sugar phosphate isomerase/epimerase [Oscillospiraceae bacterium]
MEAGLNLYTLRTFLESEEGFLDTALKLKDMGYSYLQFSGRPFDADIVSRVSERSGLPVVLTHVPMDRIIDDTNALMEEHARFGCKNIGLGAIPQSTVFDESKYKSTVEKLNTAAEKMHKNGFSFFYHNHHYEFYRMGGETVFEYLLKNAPYFNFTLDTYWVQYGGSDIIDLLDKLDGKIECVHLKDYRIDCPLKEPGSGKLAPRHAAVGDGNLDFKKICAKMKEKGTKYFLVEQDNAPEFPDPFNEVKKSINYIRKEL